MFTNTEPVHRHLNPVFPNKTTRSRKLGADFPNNESVSRKSSSGFPKNLSVRGKAAASFPLTEVFSRDIIPMPVDIETMSVTALPDNLLLY